MATRTTSKHGYGTSQSSVTISFEVSDLGVILILENQSRSLVHQFKTVQNRVAELENC